MRRDVSSFVTDGSIFWTNCVGFGTLAPARMPSPKVLFLGANGRDTTRLRLNAEVRDIRQELEAADASQAFQVMAELAVRPTDLQRLLLLHEPNVIHFSGHGLDPDG